VSIGIDLVVEAAIQFFRNPGPTQGNRDFSITFAIQLQEEEYPNIKQSIEEIEHRFTKETTFPPEITEEEIEDITHVDDDIDGSWFEGIEEFNKWDGVCNNWSNGYPSGRLPPNAVHNIDRYTNNILSHSYNPAGENYLWKGLVVGNVQSGKTATYTGLVAKAIDVGYRIIVIMSGRMNSLRYQTDERITQQVIGNNFSFTIEEDDNIIPLTYPSMKGDFGQPDSRDNLFAPGIIASLLNDGCTIVAVMKKHPSPLRRFREYIDEIAEITPTIRNLPFLLVDDEMDEAGPNTGGEDIGDDDQYDPDEDSEGEDNVDIEDENYLPSTTNRMITRLLKEECFTKRMYIGFTATPYAVLAHRRRPEGSDEYNQYGPDIFPDNYLLVLPDPDDYCGGDLFTGRAEVIVRDMWFDQHNSLRTGDLLLRLPAYGGVNGLVENIPAREACVECQTHRDARGRLSHGPAARQKSHCARHEPGQHWPISLNGTCDCTCHSEDEVHRISPPFNDIVPTTGAGDAEIDGFDYVQVTPSLQQAIDDFILAGAARIERGDGHKPCTMMINISHRWVVHLDAKKKVLAHVTNLQQCLNTPGMSLPFIRRLEERWIQAFRQTVIAFNGDSVDDEGNATDVTLEGGGKETNNPNRILATNSNSNACRPRRSTEFADIEPYITQFVNEISREENHRVLNSHTEDVVDYSREPSLKAIIHGGWNLGRGLTFKGLVTSFMLRGHGDMSGLMQMQRWCGYRGANDSGERILDLVKIYLTEDDLSIFNRLLAIEKKNRYLLGVYLRENRSPGEYKSLLEEDPDKPLMSSAKRGAIDKMGGILSGQSKLQIKYDFNLEEDNVIQDNISSLSTFIEEIIEFEAKTELNGSVFRDVPTEHIYSLINEWAFSNERFKGDVQQWISRLNDWNEIPDNMPKQLIQWTVFVASRNPDGGVVNVVDGHAADFDALQPITLENGRNIYPYPYPLDRNTTDKVKNPFSNVAEQYQQLDCNLFFNGQPRPETHGLLIISPIINPFNRNSPGGVYDGYNPHTGNDDAQHAPGEWPSLLSLGLWFPSTSRLNTHIVQHRGF
jgi:hypothetical protein